MTPERAFKSGGRNPNSGLVVHDWHIVGCRFLPMPLRHEGKILLGVRSLCVLDAASMFTMHHVEFPEKPDKLRAARLIDILVDTFELFNRPRIGVAFSHSCWMSSNELELDDDLREAGEFLREAGLDFGPMDESEKEALRSWCGKNGFKVSFNANEI